VNRFALVWIAGTVFLAAWGSQQHFLGNERLDQVGGGDTNGSNELGALFVLVLPVTLQLALVEERRLTRWVLFLVVPLFCVAIAFTGSRAAFLGFVVGGGLLFVISGQRRQVVKLALPLVPVIAVLSVWYFSKSVERIQTADQDWSAQSRLWFWAAAWRMVQAHPALGVGPGNYPLCCAAYGSPEAMRDCHSTYFTQLSETGFPAFCLWVATVGIALAAIDRARRIPGGAPERVRVRALAAGLEAGLVAFLITGAFNSFGYYEYLYWPMILGQCLAEYAERTPEEVDDGTAEAQRTQRLAESRA
jgi:O-antigen ligase